MVNRSLHKVSVVDTIFSGWKSSTDFLLTLPSGYMVNFIPLVRPFLCLLVQGCGSDDHSLACGLLQINAGTCMAETLEIAVLK